MLDGAQSVELTRSFRRAFCHRTKPNLNGRVWCELLNRPQPPVAECLWRSVVTQSRRFQVKDVDFSYVETPSTIRAYRQEIEPPANVVKSETLISAHTPSLEDTPEPGDNFGFCGMVMPSLEGHFGQTYIFSESRVYSGLSFLRTEHDYHVFSLPFLHRGHDHFKGCSGAPILSSTGSLVALVCEGDEKTNEIWGISVRAYKTPIDILAGNVE
jgi:hypothetical protein